MSRVTRARRSVPLLSLLALLLGSFASLGATTTVVTTTTTTHPGTNFVVNATDDVVSGGCDATHCSLREAITDANAVAGADTITFALGSGTQTITLASTPPLITQPVVIDGSHDPGGTGQSVVVTGSTSVHPALWLYNHTGSVVQGLTINGVARALILEYGGGHTIRGNRLGTDVSGDTAVAGFNYGAIAIRESKDNLVGGSNAGDANVISGPGHGVLIERSGSTGNRVEGNLMGTNSTGSAEVTVPSGVGAPMVRAWITNGASGNTFTGNTMVASGSNAVEISSTSANTIRDNRIGTDVTGTTPLGTGRGVSVNGATNNVIGGPSPADGNVIARGISVHNASSGTVIRHNAIGVDATGTIDLDPTTGRIIEFNGGSGTMTSGTIADNLISGGGAEAVMVLAATGITITRNAIWNNAGLGIDLWPNGTVNANDADDADGGANGGQNFPVVASAYAGSSTQAAGTLHSAPSATFTIDLYANDACDPSGHGEGRRYLGSTTATTDAAGDATWSATVGASNLGEAVTATATDAGGSTSEFSACTTTTTVPATTYDDRILFSSEVGGNRDIFTIAPDGSGRVRVTTDPGSELYATWSPDGSRIAYVQDTVPASTTGSLRIVNADGSGTPTEIHTGASLNQPTWSADGTRIAFSYFNGSSTTGGSGYDIGVVNADGTGFANLTSGLLKPDGQPGSEGDPVFSPDGNTLAFSGHDIVGGSLSNEIFVLDMTSAGAAPTQVTESGGAKYRLEWLPNGYEVTYSGGLLTAVDVRDGSTRTYSMNLGGSGYTWNGDASQVAYAGSLTGLYVRTLSSGTQTDIVPGETVFYPEWIGGGSPTLPSNTAPVANGDSYDAVEDTSLVVAAPGVLTNDTDGDGDPLTAALGSGPTNGSVTLGTDGGFTYTPNAGFDGTDTFTYTASDGTDPSAPATVTITVAPGDRDGDGVTNDADNCPDAANADQADLDGDGIGDVCDEDRDGDGLSNLIEIWLGCDPDNADTDGDGVWDLVEVWVGTNPLTADTDDDGESDAAWLLRIVRMACGCEVDLGADTNGNGIWDVVEYFYFGGSLYDPGTHGGGGYSSLTTYLYHLCGCSPDVLVDGRGGGAGSGPIPQIVDHAWGGGNLLRYMIRCGCSPWEDASGSGGRWVKLHLLGGGVDLTDHDGDGIPTIIEILLGCDPNDDDSDGDGLSDRDEIFVHGTDPSNADTDGDGMDDGREIALGCDPNDADSDDDGQPDGSDPAPLAALTGCAVATNSWDPVPLGTPVQLCVGLWGPGITSGGFDWGDGTTSTTNAAGDFTASHVYAEPGVYTVTCFVQDSTGGRHEVQHLVVVYDPNGGFVTGGGWITSPEGAYSAAPSVVAKATFGFVSKYKKDSTVPEGSLEFQLPDARLNFHSNTQSWLTVSDEVARFSGSGTINGSGDYGFVLTAVDRQLNGKDNADGIRLRIWDRVSGDTVYDNQRGASLYGEDVTLLGNGSIVIHKAK